MAIVAIALWRDYAEIAEKLHEIEATAPEIGGAMAASFARGFLPSAIEEMRAGGAAGGRGLDFGFMYARLMTACGYTRAEIDEMTLFDVMVSLPIGGNIRRRMKSSNASIGLSERPNRRGISPDPSGIGRPDRALSNGQVKAA